MSRVAPSDTAFTKAARVRTPRKKRVRTIQAVDQIFSLCVREGSDWTCARCGSKYERGAQNLHCSHFHGRRLRSGRWNPLNVCAHDAKCHMFLSENPARFHEWIKEHLGDRYDEWYDLSLVIVKVRPVDRERLYQHFKTVHEEMLRCRDRNIEGPIPFEGLQL